MTDANAARGLVQAERLLAIVAEVSEELHGHAVGWPIGLDTQLERELGLDSLARVELLMRLDRAFGVQLPDALLTDAQSPRDLLAALLGAGAAEHLSAIAHVVHAAPAVAARTPETASTLVEVLEHHAREHPERPHVVLSDGEGHERTLSYGELDQLARRVAAGLVASDLEPGGRVAIMLPASIEFFAAFFGALYAGGVPVPIYPPARRSGLEEHLRRQAVIVGNSQAAVLISFAEARAVSALLRALVPSLKTVTSVTELVRHAPASSSARRSGSDLALLQYTSGSTGDPKGVMLRHENLLANIRAMCRATEVGAADVFVSWLPLYHDMGLIGMWLTPLYLGAPAVIMSPLAFLARPERWLWTIHRHRGTVSAAPNFAYEICASKLDDEALTGLDLSSLRLMPNGAEPVSPSTVRRFVERFGRYGLRPEAIAPVYGLAECSVGLAFPPRGRPPLIERLAREPLSRFGRAEPAQPTDNAPIEVVACGRALPGHAIRVVDRHGRELPERVQGAIQFRGPSSTQGYFKNPEQTRALFAGSWLQTGDLGYLSAGDVFVTGRAKDIVIRAGRNVYPHELEQAVGELEGVRKGCVVAFGVPDPATGTEKLVVLAEARSHAPADKAALQRRITELTSSVLGEPADEIVLAPPHSVPKTSSGKLRRTAARDLYQRRRIGEPRRAVSWQLLRLLVSGLGARAVSTGRAAVELAFAGWWWLTLVAAALVVWPLVVLLPGQRERWRVFRAAARTLLWLWGLPVEREGSEPQAVGPTVVVANHKSYLDGLVLAAILPGPLAFVAKRELSHNPIAGVLLRRLGALFVERFDARRGAQDQARVRALVNTGSQPVFFPEGTTLHARGLAAFRLGAFMLAADTGLPIVPVAISGTDQVLPGHRWFPRHRPLRVQIGAAIAPRGPGWAGALQLRDATRQALLEMLSEPDLGAEAHPLTLRHRRASVAAAR